MASSAPRIAPAVKPNDSASPGSPVDAPLQPGPSSSKRKSESTSAAQKKRARVSYSCQECHRRKQKCDRQVPCGHCVARKVPELCKNYQPGKSEDFSARLARIEHIIELALPQYANTEYNSPSSPGEPAGPAPASMAYNTPHLNGQGPWNGDLSGSQGHQMLDIDINQHDRERGRSVSSSPSGSNKEEEHEPSGGTIQSGQFFGTSALGSVNSRPILDQLQPNGSFPQQIDETSAIINKMESLVQDCGVPPHKLSELVHELPSRSVADGLINYYFSSINYTRYEIYETQFRSSYESVWNNGVQAHPTIIRFLPLLFVVLAIAARLAPESLTGDKRQKRVTSLRYYWSSRRSLLIACALQPDSIELILVRLLSIRFLTFDRRITECWSQLGAAVRASQAIGLHRDPAKMPGLDAFQIEYRRRIWAYLYHADSTYGLLLGRPRSIHDAYCDAQPPQNIEDRDILNFMQKHPYPSHPSLGAMPHLPPPPPIPSHPLTKPTHATFSILRHGLAVIMGHIVHHFQQVRHHSHYSEVLQLDDELQKFASNLPPHYSLDPDTSLDMTLEFIPVHRFLIVTEIFFVRTSLHRPYILRKLDSDRFLPSRRACFDSAKRDFQVRQAFKREMPKSVIDSLGGAYREFQAAMISGIGLVIDPHGPDSEIMHTMLDTFLAEHGVGPNAPAHLVQKEWDDTTIREVKIIEFLNMKAKAAAKKDVHMTSDEQGKQASNASTEADEDEDEESRGAVEQQSAERSSFTSRKPKTKGIGNGKANGQNGKDARVGPGKLDLTSVASRSSAALNGVSPSTIGSPTLANPPAAVMPGSGIGTSPLTQGHSRTPSNILIPRQNLVASPVARTPVTTPSPKFPTYTNPSTMSPSWPRAHQPSHLASPRLSFTSSQLQNFHLPQRSATNEAVSVAGSSPSAEDESAQRMLDNWVTNATEGFVNPLAGFDPSSLFNPFGSTGFVGMNGTFGGPPSAWPGGMNIMQSGMGLGLVNTLPGPGPTMTNGLSNGLNGIAPMHMSEQPNLSAPATGVEGGDWTYWENLVSQIRASGGVS